MREKVVAKVVTKWMIKYHFSIEIVVICFTKFERLIFIVVHGEIYLVYTQKKVKKRYENKNDNIDPLKVLI
jgi:hypothetical protein